PLMINRCKDYSEILRHHAVNRGDKTAIYHGGEEISYALLEKNVNRFGNVLKKLGLKPDERIVVALPDCPDFFYAFLGGMKYGVWPILLSPDLTQSNYEYILNDSQASVLITVGSSEAVAAKGGLLRLTLCIDEERYTGLFGEAADALDSLPASEGRIAFMLYSSGSTGNPKGVPHTQEDMLFCADHYAGQILEMSEDDVVFSASKLFFAYGLGNSLIFPLYFGASIILMDHKSTPATVFQVIEDRRPTLFFGVPTLYNMMVKTLDKEASFPSLRLCVSAGEALPAGIYHGWKQLTGLSIIDGIGSTEALHIFISNLPSDVRPGSSGFVVPGYEAGIIGEDGLPVSSGQPGILLIRGKSTAPYYWNRPEITAKTMLADGWLNTGDVYVEENGCYTYQGRLDDMFKSGGNWVSPVLVEEVLRDHPAILECAVTSRRMESLVKPLAHVVLNEGYEGDMALFRELRTFVLKRLPEYMCPIQFIFTGEIPKTRTGKVQRFVLRA
ncbi:MAG: benzoate-CoA ligase family protein, partial [Syntrophales bacterium]|nr:benzoate-CoA ligase family protein [Syntrophales bacterium]